MPACHVKGNEENEPPRTPKMIAVGRGVGAAVGVALPGVVGPSGFGNKGGRDAKANFEPCASRPEAAVSTPVRPTSEMDTPSKPAPPKATRRLGKPVKTLPLGSKKAVPASIDKTGQKLNGITCSPRAC